MATVGSMIVNLGLNRRPLESGLNQSRKSLSNFAGGITKLGGLVAGLGGSFLAFAGVAKFGSMVSGSFAAIDATAKLADQLGTTTEALTGLQHAAQLSGASAATLDSSFQKMVRRLGDAQAGTGATADTLRQLGLSATELANVDAAEAFTRIGGAINELPTQAAKADAAFQIFGRQGQQLLTMFSAGEDGIRGMVAEAEQLGFAFDRAEAARIEQANDAMLRLKQSIGGAAQQMAIGLAPFVTTLANGFTQLTPIVANTMGTVSDLVLTTFDAAGWAIANWQTLAELGFKSALLGFVTFGNEVIHFFSATLPTLATWFVENFPELWLTALDFNLTALINFGQNVRNIMSGIWDFIASGGMKELSLSWTPLTEGFVSTLRELPKIPKREIGDLERSLNSEVEQLGEMTGESLRKFLNDQKKARELATGPVTPGAPTDVTGPKGQAGDLKGPAALRVGSAEGLGAVLRAQLQSIGGGSDQKKIAASNAKILAEAKRQSAALERIADKDLAIEEITL